MPRHSLTTLKIGAMVVRVCVGAGMSLCEIAVFVQQDLSKALTYAWKVSQDKAKERYCVWETELLAKLEGVVRRVLEDGEDWELCAGVESTQFE